MSLAINLILNNERRSGSKLSGRSLSRIAAIVSPLIVIVILLQQGFSRFILKTNLSILESRWESAAPRQTFAQRQQGRLNQNLQIAREIEQWKVTSPHWDAALLAIMQSTPEQIHLTNMRLDAPPATGQPPQTSPPIRQPAIRIEGRVQEPGAMAAIQSFRNAIRQHAQIEPLLESADVINFAADAETRGGTSENRVFAIAIKLKTLGETR